MRSHMDKRRKFKSTGKGGGSKKGKPQNQWPLLFVVVAEAIYRRVAGGMEALLHDRGWAAKGLDRNGEFLKAEMEKILPGVWKWVAKNFEPTKTMPWANLHNRVFKMYYSGTSDRGVGHDPNTRASISGEIWTARVPEGSELLELHTKIDRGLVTCVPDWKKRFGFAYETLPDNV